MTTVTQRRSSFFFFFFKVKKVTIIRFFCRGCKQAMRRTAVFDLNQPRVYRILLFCSYFHREVKSQTRSRRKQPWGSARLLMTEMPREAGRLSRKSHLSERMLSASAVEEENRRNTAVASGLRRQVTQGGRWVSSSDTSEFTATTRNKFVMRI